MSFCRKGGPFAKVDKIIVVANYFQNRCFLASSSSSSAMQMLRCFLRFIKDLFFLTAFQSASCKKT